MHERPLPQTDSTRIREQDVLPAEGFHSVVPLAAIEVFEAVEISLIPSPVDFLLLLPVWVFSVVDLSELFATWPYIWVAFCICQ